MRRLLCLAILVLSACGDPNAGKIFADAQWGVRDPLSNHDYNADDYNGQSGIRASCDVATTGTTRNLTFSITVTTNGTSGSIGLTNASFAGSATVPSAGCVTHVTDTNNNYSGVCGGSAPSAAQPCQVQNVVFQKDPDTMLPTVSGTIFCTGITNDASPSITRDVTLPGSASSMAMMPALFSITNCHGLHF